MLLGLLFRFAERSVSTRSTGLVLHAEWRGPILYLILDLVEVVNLGLGHLKLLDLIRNIRLGDLECLPALLYPKRVLVALLSEIVGVLGGRREELVLIVHLLASADRVDRVLRAVKLHLDAVRAGLG